MSRELPVPILRILGTGMLAGLSLTLGCEGNTTATSGTGGAGGAGGHGGAGGAPGTCDSRRGDHGDACPAGAPCAITLDVEVTCTDSDFAAGGVRAVPAAGATYLVTSSDAPTRLFELDGDGATQRDFDVLTDSDSVSVALSPDGTAYAAVNETEGGGDDDRGGRIVFLPLAGDATEKQLVFDRDDPYMPVLDVAVGSRGEPHIWINTNAPDSPVHATRTSSGAWNVAQASRPSGSDWPRFTLAPDGAPLSFGFVEVEELPGNWQLKVLDGTTERSLGAQFYASSPLDYEPVPPPQPAGQATSPRFAAVVRHPDGLRLASASDGDGFDEVAIPGTAPPTYDCEGDVAPAPASPDCPAECHRVASGLQWSAFAAARTSDGDVWIAFLISHIDETLAYEVQEMNLERVCVGHTVADESRGELRLVRVPAAGGAPEVAVTLPLPAIGGESYFNDLHEQHPSVDVSAFGTELTVAMRTQASREGPFTARVLRIDTSLLAPAAPGD